MPYENLSNIDDYQLISFIENSPELWQLGHPNYGNSSLKNQIWADIGNLMGFEASVCRNRWVNIRDNYRRSLKKSMSEKGHKTYKFFDKLNFLRSSILEGTKGNFNISQKPDFTEISSPDTKLQNEAYNFDINSESSTVTMPSTSTKRTYSPMTLLNPTLSEKRFRRVESLSANYQQRPTQQDAVDAFLAGIAPTLKSLTPYYLNLAKSKIFITVQKYEMQMIMEAQARELDPEDPMEIYRDNGDSDKESSEEEPVDTKDNILITQDVSSSKS